MTLFLHFSKFLFLNHFTATKYIRKELSRIQPEELFETTEEPTALPVSLVNDHLTWK
jgi:hypothetical protein